MFLFLIFPALLIIYIVNFLLKRSRLPPGPFPYPIVGNLPQIKKLAIENGGTVAALQALKEKYGPIFTLWVGPQPTVHIGCMSIANETMVKRGSEFVDRWVPPIMNSVRNGLGLIGSNGEQWTEQRRFTIQTFRSFGIGRGIMEEMIMAELYSRTKKLDQLLETDINPKEMFDLLVGCVVNRLLVGEPLDDADAKAFFESKKAMDSFLQGLSLFDMMMERSWATRLPLIRGRWERLREPQAKVKSFLEEQVKTRIRDIETGKHVIAEEPGNYVDAYLAKMKEEEEKGGETTYSREALAVNLFDLWLAGQETTVITFIMSFAYLLNHMDVMEKVREELREVTNGRERLSLKDKPSTPYFNATITELQRVASILNMNVYRKTKEDTPIGEYVLPKDTAITAQLSLLLSDSKIFDQPTKFDPSRFLSGQNLEQFVPPFGMGKRSCLGESLARAEIYLVLGNLILWYDIQPTEKLPSIELKNNFGVVKRASDPYTMRFKKF